MERGNCWEVKKCGREPGGANIGRLGVCPAALPIEYDGVNQGKEAGRFCWAVAGTLSGGQGLGTCVRRPRTCLVCEFLKQVIEEEGRGFLLTPNQAKGDSQSEA